MGLGCGCSPNCFEVITVYYRLNNFMRAFFDSRIGRTLIVIFAIVASGFAGAGVAIWLVRW